MSGLTLLDSKDLHDYEVLIKELKQELGDRFENSMQNWCGIGSRPYPLKTWEVYIAKDVATSRIVGLCSYYQQMEESDQKYWMGWLGVLPMFRRNGMGTALAQTVERLVVARGARELWVHLNHRNVGLQSFYEGLGLRVHGRFGAMGIVQASADPESLVMWKPLLYSEMQPTGQG